MLTKKMLDSLNDQINKELYSGYLYLSMAAYAATLGLKGYTSWFKAQTKEEFAHAYVLFDYVIKQGGRVALPVIAEPPKDFGTALDLAKKVLSHEQFVTGLIAKLVKTSQEEKDKATEDFLQWFVKEQVEEEESSQKVIDMIEPVANDKEGLKKVDAELAKRK